MPDSALRATPLELAASRVVGAAPDAPPLPVTRRDPLAALEDAIVPFLAQPPCLVSYSGGRDSAILLAAAARAARREGLSEPIAFTWIYDDPRQQEESAWQERIVAHIGLESWERCDAGAEHDALGPLAAQILRRHGVLYPWNAFTTSAVLERARGGSLLTGWGGHDVLGGWRWSRAFDVLGGRTRPGAHDVLHLANLLAPAPLRVSGRRGHIRAGLPPWLTSEAKQELLELLVPAWRSEPRRWDRWLAWYSARRQVAVTRHTLDLLAADAGASVGHPLFAPEFVGALAGRGGASGWGDRSATNLALFSELLPAEALTRPTPSFPDAFWGPETRAFLSSWTGGGVDRRLVDEAALREAWSRRRPHGGTGQLVQLAWLAASAGEPVHEQGERVR